MTRYLEERGWLVHPADIVDGIDALQGFRDSRDVGLPYDLVVHAAAAGPNRKAIDTQRGNFPYNVMLDAAMFEWAIRTQQRRIVYLSSSAVYSNEIHMITGPRPFYENDAYPYRTFDTYGETKRFGEQLAVNARNAGVRVTVVRPFSGYGSDQSEDFPFGAFVGRARRREDPFMIWGNASQVRDWIHIDDICAAIMTLVEADVDAPVNICTGRGVTMRDLALLCHEAVGYAPRIDVDPTAPMGVLFRVGDPTLLHSYYTPKITIEEGVRWALNPRTA